jgi:hypothetical protein
VSKASDDLPDPDTPVMTTRRFLGISRLRFLRLCSRAPRMEIESIRIVDGTRKFPKETTQNGK